MRRMTLAVVSACAILGIVGVSQPNAVTSIVSAPDSAHAEYVALFNRKKAEMPSHDELGRIDKHMRPDMFHLHDKLQRMDPRTGEVPADGYTRAYAYIQETWGQSLLTESSGNALVWEERGPGGIGGRTRAMLWDPNDATHKAFFAGGVGGGLWRTSDVTMSAPTWVNVSPVFSNVAVTCINSDPTNAQTLYYGTGEGWFNADAIRGAGVWKSTDGGSTWNVLPATQNSSYYYCQDITVTNDGTVYVGTKTGLMRSADGGQSFVKCLGTGTGLGGDFITDLETSGNGDVLAAISGSGIYRSLASLGAAQGTAGNWVRLAMNFPLGYERIELAAGKNNSNYMYAVANVNQSTSSVYRTTNGGTNWAATSGQPEGGSSYANDQAWYDLALEVDPNDHLTLYTGGIDTYRSTNGGTNWTQLTAAYGGTQPYMHPDQHNVIINPFNSNQVVFGNDGGVHYSPTKGTNPVARNETYNITQFYSLAIDPRSYSDILIGGTQDNGSIMVNQSGIGMGIDLTGADGSYCAINPQYPDTMFTTSQYEPVYRTRNGGTTFSYIGNLNLDDTNTLFINPLEIDPSTTNVIYQASTSLWRHPNANGGGSGSWVRVTASLGSNITAIAPATTPTNLVYFAAGGTIYRLPNAHQANSSTQPGTVNPTGAGSGYINCILVNPSNGNHIILTYSSFGVVRHVVECRNADQGANATWKNLSGNLPDLPCNWAAFEPNNPNGIVIGTDMGIFRCSDITLPEANIYWSPENTGLGLPRVSMIKTKYSDNSVHIATHGRGFFSTHSYNQAPVALFGVGNTTACGGAVQFIDSTFNAPISWAWNFGDGGISTQQSPIHVYASSGTYNVSLTASNPINSSTYNMSVNVTVLPSAVAVAGPDMGGCPGDSLQLTASGGVSYAWLPASGLSNPAIANPIAILNGNRTYVVTVTDANGCSDTDTLVVTQLAAPSIWAGQDQTIIYPNDSVQLQGNGGQTYVWSPATGLSCTACPNPKASPSVTTVYTCMGFNANGCGRSDNMTVFVNLVGIDNPDGSGVVFEAISPNPVQDLARIAFSLAEAGPVRISLVDMSGRTLAHLHTGEHGTGKHSFMWDSKGVAAGVYFVRMEAAGQMFSRKLIIAN